MPNKDSFTFSDKLRKSKSVPLSKRLPSIVGGQNKQKRTLVQRAQRDLPFILVAACALLLLPFLSKNGSDDIAAPGELNWGAAQEEPSYAEGGGADIMPAGAMTDPLDLILRPRNAVEEPALKPEEATRNAYRSPYDNDRDSSYRRSTTPRSSYDDRADYDRKYSDKASKPSTIEKFGKKTRPSVRNSIVRKGTEINRALRVSQMPSGKGGTGVSHALPLGQGPANVSSPSGPNPGVRPIALQPMEARGTVGRSLTGENLYAEAARSINAMNAGRGAKANLLAAQMKDVDGTLTPMGAGGSFGGGGSARPGAGGGGPNNTNGYHIDKPWWWDMMQKRSQMWWELFQYKWREMLWTNIYDIVFNGGKQIVNCLLFGSKDVDVSHMFGQGAGDDDWRCMKDGKEIMVTYNNQKTTDTKDKDGNTTHRSVDSNWFLTCKELGGQSEKDPASDKGFFGVRAKCLGLDVLGKKIKSWTDTEYHHGCDGVTVDSIDYSVDVRRKGLFDKELKDETRRDDKVVIALVAKRNRVQNEKYDDNEYVVFAENSKYFTGEEFAKDFKTKYPKCHLTKIVSFVSTDGIGGGWRVNYQLREGEEATRYSVNEPLKYAAKRGTWFHPYSGGVNFAREYCRTGIEKGSIETGKKEDGTTNASIKKRALTLNDLKNKFDPRDGSLNSCPIPTPGQHIEEMYLDGHICQNYPSTYIHIDQGINAQSIVKDASGKYVYAVLVEELTSQSKSVVRNIYKFTGDNEQPVSKAEGARPNNKNAHGYTYDEEKGFRFYLNSNFAAEGGAEYGERTDPAAESNTKIRGTGKVIWLVTSQKKLNKEVGEKMGALGTVNPSDFVEDYANSGACSYNWCRETAECSDAGEKLYCRYDENKDYITETEKSQTGDFFEAVWLEDKKVYLRTTTAPVTEDGILKYLNTHLDNIPECTPMGLHESSDYIYKISNYKSPTPSIDDSNRVQQFTSFAPYRVQLRDLKGKEGILPYLYTQNERLAAAGRNVAEKCVIMQRFDYITASVVPSNTSEIESFKTKIKECMTAIDEYEAVLPQGETFQGKKLYFYGYSSTEGNGNDNCDGNNNVGVICNKALSEDRNLYLTDNMQMSVTTDANYSASGLSGFTNTNCGSSTNKRCLNSKKRYTRSTADFSANYPDWEIVSVACGATGATNETISTDRYVFVVPELQGGVSCDPRLNTPLTKQIKLCTNSQCRGV